ncbi:MAG: Trk family potassium uptake protein [Syntrophomonadaceae bacterium]|nr:Trk family potassium uptake protein [Syntrophomonadaceae bacterium]
MIKNKINEPLWLALSFITVIMAGSVLLYLPWASRSGYTAYIDCLFISTSATCINGLVTLDTATHWTLFGKIVILFLIQIGGLGVMSFAVFYALLAGRKIFLRQRLVMQQAVNVAEVGGVVRLFRHLLGFTFTVEAIGALILALRWSGEMGWGKALWFGIFHSVSAFNNAGIDLMGGFKSFTGYTSDITVNLVISTLVIIGGLGFIVTYDLYHYREQRKLSLHAKVVLITTGLLLLIGTLLLLVGEYNHALKDMPFGTKLLAAYFQSATSRTGGFSTIDLTGLFLSSQLVIIILMLIGASPGSTGGGIKTSTIAILWLAIYSQLRGKKDTEIFERRIDTTDVMQAMTIFLLFSFAMLLMTYLVSLTYPSGNFTYIVFEVASALSTTGWTLGLTPHLTALPKFLLIITMFLGRVGPLTLGLALALKDKQPDIHWPKGKIMVG